MQLRSIDLFNSAKSHRFTFKFPRYSRSLPVAGCANYRTCGDLMMLGFIWDRVFSKIAGHCVQSFFIANLEAGARASLAAFTTLHHSCLGDDVPTNHWLLGMTHLISFNHASQNICNFCGILNTHPVVSRYTTSFAIRGWH